MTASMWVRCPAAWVTEHEEAAVITTPQDTLTITGWGGIHTVHGEIVTLRCDLPTDEVRNTARKSALSGCIVIERGNTPDAFTTVTQGDRTTETRTMLQFRPEIRIVDIFTGVDYLITPLNGDAGAHAEPNAKCRACHQPLSDDIPRHSSTGYHEQLHAKCDSTLQATFDRWRAGQEIDIRQLALRADRKALQMRRQPDTGFTQIDDQTALEITDLYAIKHEIEKELPE